MGFFDSIGEWFNNTLIKSTYDPVADQLKQIYRQNVYTNLTGLHQTAAYIGGGLGNALLSIPGVSKATSTAFNALQKESEALLSKANNMSPDQIAKANDDLQKKAYDLQLKAQREGKTVEQVQEEEDPSGFSFKRLFKRIFENVMFIAFFITIIVIGLLSSRMLSNAAFNSGKQFVIYYTLYGLILPLFGGYILFKNYFYDDPEVKNYFNYFYGSCLVLVPLVIGFLKFNNPDNKIHALWAPIINGFSSNIYINTLLFPFVYNDPSKYDKTYNSSDVIKTEDNIYEQREKTEYYNNY